MKTKTFMKIKKYSMVILCTLALISCATTVSHIGTDNWHNYFKPGHTKEEITKNFNLHRGKWWNYYIRGRWFAEGEFWDEAVQDFQKALSLRSVDLRSARSYGMHFLEYFAHRELGITYYNQEKFDDAKRELETSLSTAESSRAKFYLNKCNETLLKKSKVERESPQIKVSSYADGEMVNSPVVKLLGFASGDGYINDISIQGKRVFVELAAQQVPFNEAVKLIPGDNIICLEASDFLGKRVLRKLKITFDTRPPILYLDDIQVKQKNGTFIASIKGAVTDNYALKEFSLNNKAIYLESATKVDFDEEIPLTGEKNISFTVTDIAGNITQGEYHLESKSSLLPRNQNGILKHASLEIHKPVLIAANTANKNILKAFLVSQNVMQNAEDTKNKTKGAANPQNTELANIPPVITTDIEPCTVYSPDLCIHIQAHDDVQVSQIFVNQQQVEIRPAKHIFFDYILSLNEGENNIIIKALDTQGNETQLKPVKVTRKTFDLPETDARYTVALLPMKSNMEDLVPPETMYSLLLKAFDEEPRRFNFVERDPAKLEQILKEQKISATELSSPDTAVKIGKIRVAEGILAGAVEKEGKGINIILRLIDTETTRVLANTDIYLEDINLQNLEWMTHALALKIKQLFPTVQGIVIKVSGKGFHIDAGNTSNVSIGMKLLLFREVKVGKHMIREPLSTIARISQVEDTTSFAVITNAKEAEKVKKKDIAITK